MGEIKSKFAELVFTKEEMKKRLIPTTYEIFMDTLQNKRGLDETIADDIARAIKEWAIENKATHFTHWFQPQRSGTAEKHDAFISYNGSGEIIEHFSSGQLIQSEPDASSFPSGGIRSTFEARGYTAWDPTSPVFLREHDNGRSLIIPSIYLSWTGEALDMKTPLNRSMKALNTNAIKLQRLLGNRVAKNIKVFSGLEQEYFLLPKDKIGSRMDLKICGRTVLGAEATKGQLMEDHYFGSIQSKVMVFMNDLEKELYRYGIPIKTKHNEVAPNQFELAPLYEEMNLAIDHNLETMEIMTRIAEKHDLMVTFHEKPFEGVNGSGKHMNWSIGDNTGANYLEPSRSPAKNISFLMTVAAILLGVKEYSGLLLSSILHAGNELRLGANEAPPAIMSVYFGSYLSDLLDHIEGTKTFTEKELNYINHGLENMPKVVKDTSDRNRTSPIAFTGNKFELRALGASSNGSSAATVLNLMCTYGYREILTKLESKKGDVKKNALLVLKDVLKKTKSVRFEGNNYSDDWKDEAAKRKLFQVTNTPDAIKFELEKKCVDLFESFEVLNEREIHSRVEIKLDAYSNSKSIELKVALDMIRKDVLPAIISQLSDLSSTYKNLMSVKLNSISIQKDIKILESLYSSIQTKETYLTQFLYNTEALDDSYEKAKEYATKGVELMHTLRQDVDHAEKRVSRVFWRLSSYDELLLSI